MNPEQTVGDHLKRIGVETAAGAAITPLAHGLMNAVQNLRKTKGILLLLTYRMMSFSRKDNKGIHQSSCGRTSITRYTYQNEPESLPIQAASESAPSLEQAIESVAKQKRKLLQMENFLMTYKRCAMHLRSFNPLWRQMGDHYAEKVNG